MPAEALLAQNMRNAAHHALWTQEQTFALLTNHQVTSNPVAVSAPVKVRYKCYLPGGLNGGSSSSLNLRPPPLLDLKLPPVSP